VALRPGAVEDLGLTGWNGRRVLVTGHTGFKGGWLALWLARLGARVAGCSLGPPTRPSLYELARVGAVVAAEHEVDVRDRAALARVVAAEEPEVVIHLAAQPLVRRSFEAPAETFDVNAGGTANLLESLRAAGTVRVAVIVTTDKVYLPRRDGAAHTEDDPLGGADPYSASKACAELITRAYRESFLAGSGTVAVATARAGNVIGGGDYGADRLVPDLIRAASAGAPAQVRNPGAVRPWQHVLEPLSGYLALAQLLWSSADGAGGWNFGPERGGEQPVQWLVERFAGLWDGGLEWERAPGDHPPESPVLRLDSSKARSRLGWAPRWELERALAETVDWHRRVASGADARAVTEEQIEGFERAGRP
jgi:CDP-glucose 4,6-dehydratase